MGFGARAAQPSSLHPLGLRRGECFKRQSKANHLEERTEGLNKHKDAE